MKSRRALMWLTGLILVLVAGAIVWHFVRQDSTAPATTSNLEKAPSVAKAPTAAPSTPGATHRKSEKTAKTEAEGQTDETPIKVYGTVTDARTGSPIPGATVSTTLGAFEDIQGSPFSGMMRRAAKEAKKAARTASPEDKEQIDAMSDEDGSFDALMASKRTETKTDANGAYSFDVTRNPVMKEMELRCKAAGYATQHKQPSGAEAPIRLDFVMVAGARVSGHVLDADTGKGVGGITVTAKDIRKNDGGFPFNFAAMMNGQSGDPTPTAKSEEDGAYALDGLPEGNYELTAQNTEAGYLKADKSPVIVNAAQGGQHDGVDVTVVLGGMVEGTVRDSSGKPIADVSVDATSKDIDLTNITEMMASRFGGPNTTDAEGKFKAVGLAHGREYVVTAKHDDFAVTRSEPFQIQKGELPKHLDLVLTKGSTLTGLAHDAKKAPVPGARLFLQKKDTAPMDFGDGFGREKAGDDGRFTIAHLAAGDYVLSGSFKPRFGNRDESKQVELTVDGKTDIANIELVVDKEDDKKPTGIIKGTVLNADGKPVFGANVKVSDGFRFDAGRSTTGGDGAFKIEGIPEGNYTVKAESNGKAAIAKDVKTGTEVTLKLQPQPTVTGIVLDAAGEAVAKCSVSLKSTSEDKEKSFKPEEMVANMQKMMGMGDTGSSTTDESGLFTITTEEAGSYIVHAKSTQKGAGDSDPVVLGSTEKPPRVTIRLEAAVTFSGVVYDPKGAALAGATVKLAEADTGFAAMVSGFLPEQMKSNSGSAISDSTGAFSIPNVADGKYTVSAQHPSFAAFRAPDVDVPKRTGVSRYIIRMAQGGSAKGTYTIDGKPAANVMIMLMGEGGSRMVTTDSQGQFEVTGLPSGTYMLRTMSMNFAGGGDEAFNNNSRKVEIVDGQVANIPLGDAAGVKVSGKIAGDDLPKTMMVTLTPVDQKKPDMSNFSMETMMANIEEMSMNATAIVKPDGSFDLPGIEPGDYNLEVHSLDHVMEMAQQMQQSNGTAFQPPAALATQRVTVGKEPVAVTVGVTPK